MGGILTEDENVPVTRGWPRVSVKSRFKISVLVYTLAMYTLALHSCGVILWSADSLGMYDTLDLHSHGMPRLISDLQYASTPGSAAPLHHRFSLENISPRPGAKSKGGTCGIFKSFFQLASDPSVGYLVSQFDDTEDMDPVQVERNAMQVQWERGQYLSETYGLQHLMLAPPERLYIKTSALADYMSNHNSKDMGTKKSIFSITVCRLISKG